MSGWWICILRQGLHNQKEIVLLSSMDYILWKVSFSFFPWQSSRLTFWQPAWSSKLWTKLQPKKVPSPPGSLFPIQWSPGLDSLKEDFRIISGFAFFNNLQEPTDYCLFPGCGRLYVLLCVNPHGSPLGAQRLLTRILIAEPLFVAGERTRADEKRGA